MSREDRARFDLAHRLSLSASQCLLDGCPNRAIELYGIASSVAPVGDGQRELRRMAEELRMGLLDPKTATRH